MTKGKPPTKGLSLEMYNFYTNVVKNPRLAEAWLKVYEDYDQYVKDWNEDMAKRLALVRKPT